MGQSTRTLWSRRWNSTTSILTIPANLATELGAQTIMAGVVPIGAGGGGTNAYIFANANGAANGVRFIITHNAGNPLLSFGADSATTFQPSTVASGVAANYLPYGTYSDVAATWDGSLTAANIRLYRGVSGAIISEVAGYISVTNGTTAINGPAGQPIVIGNSSSLNRAFNGDIFYVARWNRTIGLTEMRMVQQQGPLRIKEGLVMCWANDRDWGPTGLNPSTVTALGWGQSSAFAPRLYVGRRRDFVFMPAASTFQAAWARNANTVHTTGARPA